MRLTERCKRSWLEVLYGVAASIMAAFAVDLTVTSLGLALEPTPPNVWDLLLKIFGTCAAMSTAVDLVRMRARCRPNDAFRPVGIKRVKRTVAVPLEITWWWEPQSTWLRH